MKKLYAIVLFVLISFSTSAQLIVVIDTNSTQLVNNFILLGVTASNVQYTGAPNTLGTFSNGAITNLGMTDGIVMTTGVLNGTPAIGSPVSNFASTSNSFSGDTILNTLIPGYYTYDASILEFDLIPAGNILEFQYVFASEEYPEWVGSSYNDVFGFFISGPNPVGGNYANENIAIIPGTSLPVAINNVNVGLNSTYFIDNETLGGSSIVFDGFTTVLMCQLTVVPSSTYHLKMAIADAGDGIYDSGIFLKAQSMKSYMITGVQESTQNTTGVYPSPLTENSVLKFNLSQYGRVIINFNDYTGRLVQQVIDEYPAGSNSVSIGQYLKDSPSGLYFISIHSTDGSNTIKVMK
jgi:hypothetical protein